MIDMMDNSGFFGQSSGLIVNRLNLPPQFGVQHFYLPRHSFSAQCALCKNLTLIAFIISFASIKKYVPILSVLFPVLFCAILFGFFAPRHGSIMDLVRIFSFPLFIFLQLFAPAGRVPFFMVLLCANLTARVNSKLALGVFTKFSNFFLKAAFAALLILDHRWNSAESERPCYFPLHQTGRKPVQGRTAAPFPYRAAIG